MPLLTVIEPPRSPSATIVVLVAKYLSFLSSMLIVYVLQLYEFAVTLPMKLQSFQPSSVRPHQRTMPSDPMLCFHARTIREWLTTSVCL